VRPPTPPPQGATCPYLSSASPRVPKQRDLGCREVHSWGSNTHASTMCHRRESNPLNLPSRLEGAWGTQPSPAGGLGETPNDRTARTIPFTPNPAAQFGNLGKHGSPTSSEKQSPTSEHGILTSKSETPTSNHKTPTSNHKTPTSKPETPTSASKNLTSEPEALTSKPKDLTSEPEALTSEPKTPRSKLQRS
jgi:hypothetical protein